MGRKYVMTSVSIFAVLALLNACSVKDTPSEVEDLKSVAFFDTIETGRYYIKYSSFGALSEGILEIAADGENVEFFQYYLPPTSFVHTMVLGNMYYTLDDENKILYFNAEPPRASDFNLSRLLIFQDYPCGTGTSNVDLGSSPDEKKYYYEEYSATVGELRSVWLFSNQTPDDLKIFLRIYFSGSALYAFGYGTEEDGINLMFKIYEFSKEIPNKFTFELPADYERREAITFH